MVNNDVVTERKLIQEKHDKLIELNEELLQKVIKLKNENTELNLYKTKAVY
jgi:hypothetical protein